MRSAWARVLICLAMLVVGAACAGARAPRLVEPGLSISGTVSAIGQAADPAYQRLSYTVTLYNGAKEPTYVAWVEPLLVRELRRALLPEQETRQEVRRRLAAGASLQVQGELTFDPGRRSKEEISAWEPYLIGWNVSNESLIRTAAAQAPNRIIGYVRGVQEKGGKRTLIFDEVEWLTDVEAAYMRRLHGECSGPLEECQPPNPFFISNPSTQTRQIEVAPSAEIIMATYSHAANGQYQSNEPITWATFASFWAPAPTIRHLSAVPYWLSLNDGKAVQIEEQYLP